MWINLSRCTALASAASAVLTLVVVGCDKPSPRSAAGSPPADSVASAAQESSGSIPVDWSLGWCDGHGVPESVCTRCDASLSERFQAAGDWCREHGLPESQCAQCHPDVRERWAALRAQADPDAPAPGAAPPLASLKLEPIPGLLAPGNDPLCTVDALRVRFRDAAVAADAGIRTERVEPRRISAAIDVPAEVEFDATRVTRITPRAAGVVRLVVAQIGQEVQAGDLLALLDSSVLGEAKSRYIERKQDYELAQSEYERVLTIHEGEQRLLEAVAANSGLEEIGARLDDAPVGESKARLLRAHAALQLARAEAAREALLLEKKISSQRDFQAAQSAAAAAQADFAAVREEIAFGGQRNRQAAERALAIARAAVDAAERELHILGLSDEQVRAIGSEPDTQLSCLEVRSPAAGRVVEHHAAAGEAAAATDVLFVVADASTMWLLADVSAGDLLLLAEGAPLLFTVDGLPGVSFEGRVQWISSRVDDRTRTVRVRADLPNERGLLRARMFGRARIVVHDDADVLSVPLEAVQTDGCCQLVFVRQDEVTFAPRKVALGARSGGYAAVLGGLQAGEVVATTGSFLMKTEILKSNIGAGCCEVDPGR